MNKKEEQELFKILGRWRGNGYSRIYQSEFFTEKTKTITEEEFQELNDPYNTQQDLLKIINAWYEHALSILKVYGYDWEHGFHIPSLGGLFSFQRYEIKEKEAQDAYVVIEHASKVYRLLFKGDKYALASAAIDLGLAISTAHVRPHEHHAEIGRKSLEGSKNGGPDPKATEDEVKEALDNAYLTNPDHKKGELQEAAGDQLGISARQIRNITSYDPRKK